MTLRRLAGDTLIYGSGYILGKVLNYLLVTIYLTWKFDGEEAQYGLYTEFYFYVALLLIFLTLRMETTFFRFASRDGDHSKAFGQAAVLLIFTAAVWTAILIFNNQAIATALQYPNLKEHVLVLGLVITLDVLVAIPFASLRLEQRPLRFAALKLSGIGVNILGVLFFLEVAPALNLAWYDADMRLFYVFLSNLLGSLFVFGAFIPKYFGIRWSFDREYLRRLFKYALPLVIVGIAGVINQSGYIVLLKEVLPGELMENLGSGGIYAAATRVAILMSLFITAFNYAAEPFFFNQSREVNARETYADVARAFSIAGMTIFVVVLLYLDLIQLIIGRSFREGLFVVPILLMAFFLLGLYYNFSIWYKLVDKTRYGAIISGIGTLITIGLSLLLIPSIGIVGSAWAALACYGFMAAACYVIGKKHYPVPYDIKRILTIIIIGLITYATSATLTTALEPSLAVSIAVNTLLLAAFLTSVYALERKMIREILRIGV